MTRGQNVVLVETWVDGTRRRLAVSPAYGPDNGANGSLGFEFSVKRGGTAVSWEFFAGWYTIDTRLNWARSGMPAIETYGNGEVVRHSTVQFTEDQSCHENCTVLGAPCYSTGSSVQSRALFDRFVLDPDGLWGTLEALLRALEAEIEQELANARNFS